MRQIILILWMSLIVFPKAMPVLAGQSQPEGAIAAEWPEIDFTAAYDNFNKDDFAAASNEIKKGAAFLKVAAGRSSGKIKETLTGSYNELQKLSEDVEKGAGSSKELRTAFSHAHQALGEYYHERLEKSWLRKDTERAGRELDAATSNLERGIAWLGNDIGAETDKVIKESRSLGDRLSKKAEWTEEEVRRGIMNIGKELEKLNKGIDREK